MTDNLRHTINNLYLRCSAPAVLILLFSVVFSSGTHAQVDPGFTQYMYNTIVINPAYAGSKENFSAGIMSRHQWLGFEGAPQTQTLSLHNPFNEGLHGLGASYTRDVIGPVSNDRIAVDYAFHIHMNETSKLALGLKTGFESMSLRTGNLNPLNPNISDPAYYTDDEKRSSLSFGAGLFYYTNNFYLGFSSLDIQRILLNSSNPNRSEIDVQPTYYLTSGFVWDATSAVKFKPSLLIKKEGGSPISADINFNTMINENIVAGVSHRVNDSFGFMFQVQAFQGFWIGYAYDLGISALNNYNRGTHEAMIVFDLMNEEKTYIIESPRFF